MTPIRRIQSQVAQHYGVTLDELLSRKRHRPLVQHRQLAMYLARTLTSASYPAIGRDFRGMDHSTVIWAVAQVEKRLVTDCELVAAAEIIAIAFAAVWSPCA